MNPLNSPANSLFLPLTQLNPHCTRLLNSLSDGRTSQKEKILLEQTLWNEVKKIRTTNDTSIFLHLIGYYHVILYQIAKLSAQSDLLQYHVLIRLGDLNRYTNRTDVAEYYYCNARNLFPQFGHAYNQLGLLTNPTNCFKSCYYYARAAKSSDKPLNTIADSNLRIAVSKYARGILDQILNDGDCLSIDEANCCEESPRTAFEWFYVIVVAIYADNIQPITKLFLSYVDKILITQKETNNLRDRESYVLLSNLDMLLDWIRLGTQGKALIPTISAELRQIKSYVQSMIVSFDTSSITESNHLKRENKDPKSLFSNLSAPRFSASSSDSKSNFTLQDSTFATLTVSSNSLAEKSPALPHDYVMRGFGPLCSVHSELDFKNNLDGRGILDDNSMSDNDLDGNFINTGQLVQLILRLKSKLDTFGPLLKRKQTRNIALASILSNLDKNDVLL